jgi:tripartite-type tricarboxylate transporter receptor subunit TctC
MTAIRRLFRLAASVAGIALAGAACAQGFPSKPIRLVITFPPGGTNDFLGRVISQKLQEKWGQPVVLENRPGAGGNIGSDYVAKSAPDGHTLLLGTNTLAMSRYLTAKMPFDVQKDLAPVAMIGSTPFAVVVNNNLPVKSIAELIAYAKANPDRLSFGSAGVGTPHHLGTELFKTMTGTRMVHVPYKGSAAALTDVMSGQIQLMWITINVANPFINSGKVRAIGVGEPRRLASNKDIPAIAETVPGYEVSAWYAVLAPAGTPAEVVGQLSIEIQRAFQAPEVRERLTAQGIELAPAGAESLRATIAADLDTWGKVVADAGIRPE